METPFSELLRGPRSCTFVCYQCAGLYISNNVDSSTPTRHTYTLSFHLIGRLYACQSIIYYYTFVNIHYIYRHIIVCSFFFKV